MGPGTVTRGAASGLSFTRELFGAFVVRPAEVLAGRVTVAVFERAMASELVDLLARDLVRYQVIERVTDHVLASGAVDRILDRVDAAEVPQRIADRLLEDGIAEQVAERLLSGPELERIVELAMESEGVRSAVARVMEDVATQLPETEAMWTLVDEIAQSPAVTEAIAHQGVGFADQVADDLRERSRNADARLERAAWRLFRRRTPGPRPGPGPGPGEAPAT